MAELASRLDVSEQAVQRWETNTRSISVEKLIEVAHALGVPSCDLLPDTPKLSKDETEWLEWLRQATPAERQAVRALRHGFNESKRSDFQPRKNERR